DHVATVRFVSTQPKDTWTHVLLTMHPVDGNRVYVNGTLTDTYESGFSSADYQSLEGITDYVNIGCLNDYTYSSITKRYSMQGRVSDFSVWNRALTAEEAAALY
ncbi:unnamed protein product, partial [Ectocarpus fasciculatus]